jgi:hypothetical protein
MKLKPHFSLFLLLIIPLNGCVKGETLQPIQGTELLSPTVESSTSTTAPTLTLTPIATLVPQEITETLQPLIEDPMNCSVPCFWGIIPGKTRLNDVDVFFKQLGFTPFEGYDPSSGRDFYTIEYKAGSSANSSFTLYISNGVIENIDVKPRIVKQKEGNPREWIAYSPETLIKRYGTPTDVEFGVDWQQSVSIAMVMYFSSPDLSVLYEGYDMDFLRFCPLTAPFDYVDVLIGPSPKFLSMDYTVPLEKATSLTLDQFSQLMLGDPKKACFSISQKPWLGNDE